MDDRHNRPGGLCRWGLMERGPTGAGEYLGIVKLRAHSVPTPTRNRAKWGVPPRTTRGPAFLHWPAISSVLAGHRQGDGSGQFRAEKREVTGSTPVPTTGNHIFKGIVRSEAIVVPRLTPRRHAPSSRPALSTASVKGTRTGFCHPFPRHHEERRLAELLRLPSELGPYRLVLKVALETLLAVLVAPT